MAESMETDDGVLHEEAASPRVADDHLLHEVSTRPAATPPEHKEGSITHREMMMELVKVRQEHDTSKCETFDPAKLSAVSKEVMGKRHRTILLDAGEGNQMEVGTALRNQRMQKENSSMETKLKSRLARWRAVSKVASAVATPLSTTGYITQCNVFIVSVKISEAPTIAMALVHTVTEQEATRQDVAVQSAANW